MNLQYLFLTALCFFLLSVCSSEEEPSTPVIPINVQFEPERSITFTGDPVQYFDMSTGNPISWSWEFSNGNPEFSSDKNPLVAYETTGKFAVSLTVSNGSTEATRRKLDQIAVIHGDNPPYDGTVWVEANFITQEVPSTFESLEYIGQEVRTMYDRRVDKWVDYNAHIFQASFKNGHKIDVQVNPEFTRAEGEVHANTYAHYSGQLPAFMLEHLHFLSIHDSNASFGGGSNTIDIYVDLGESAINSGHIEELMLHEGGHVALQHLHNDPDYREAVNNDRTFISTYARDFPLREDISESIVPYIGLKFNRKNLSEEMRYVIARGMEHRIQFFDAQDFDFAPFE